MRAIILIPILFFTLFTQANFAYASVFINEIAWMGTSVSPANEWIEIANNGNTPVDMTGWIFSIEGKKDITLSGNIGALGYYLIERTDDTTVPNIPADLISSFGTGGISNAGAILSLKDANGTVVDRVDGSSAWSIGGVVAGDNATKETAQRGTNGWFTGAPTPRALNSGMANPSVGTPSVNTQAQAVSGNTPSLSSSPSSISASFPVEQQIIADIGNTNRVVSVGATATFIGRAFGLKKEPIENARFVWSFGDGGRAEGASVTHTFYYPGEYIVVLDVASGYYSASSRAFVRAYAPLLSLRVGGDGVRSFVSIENRGDEEVDLSLWQIENAGKIFIIPKNTILLARRTLTFPSEITGLIAPKESIASLRFQNGAYVETQNNVATTSFATIKQTAPITEVPEQTVVKALDNKEIIIKQATSKNKPLLKETSQQISTQEASVAKAFEFEDVSTSTQETGALWQWYVGVAFFGAFALLGLRFAREKKIKNPDELNVDDFEIIEDKEPF